MDKEKFYEIMNKDVPLMDGDSLFDGILIIRKYFPKKSIEGAEHDVVFSVSADTLIEAGITEEEATLLRKLGWMIDSDYGTERMALFV